MSERSALDSINQNLGALSLQELLEVRANIDVLIEKKASQVIQNRRTLPRGEYYFGVRSTGSYHAVTKVLNKIDDVDILLGTSLSFAAAIVAGSPLAANRGYILHGLRGEYKEYQAFQALENLADKEDDSLETVIKLVDEWMNDESGYDEEAYPQIEEGLKQNRTSL